MLLRTCTAKDLAIDLLRRSECNVQMAAVLSDKVGIFAWGYNNSGPRGDGCHAEAHALTRANRKRLHGATITVAGVRRGRGRVLSAPCEECAQLIAAAGLKTIEYHDKDGVWWTKVVR